MCIAVECEGVLCFSTHNSSHDDEPLLVCLLSWLVQDLLGFSCVRPLKTVAAFLEERGRLEMLDDPLMEVCCGSSSCAPQGWLHCVWPSCTAAELV